MTWNRNIVDLKMVIWLVTSPKKWWVEWALRLKIVFWTQVLASVLNVYNHDNLMSKIYVPIWFLPLQILTLEIGNIVCNTLALFVPQPTPTIKTKNKNEIFQTAPIRHNSSNSCIVISVEKQSHIVMSSNWILIKSKYKTLLFCFVFVLLFSVLFYLVLTKALNSVMKYFICI